MYTSADIYTTKFATSERPSMGSWAQSMPITLARSSLRMHAIYVLNIISLSMYMPAGVNQTNTTRNKYPSVQHHNVIHHALTNHYLTQIMYKANQRHNALCYCTLLFVIGIVKYEITIDLRHIII